MALCWLAASGATAPALATEAVTNTLSVIRIVTGPDGTEHKEEALSAKPGDVLEYRAIYRNAGTSAARQLQATIPIPNGATYVPNSPVPANALASIDGVSYAPLPLKRPVRRADGTVVSEAVAPIEYRFVRWSLNDLGAGASVAVSVRVIVSVDAPPVAAAPVSR